MIRSRRRPLTGGLPPKMAWRSGFTFIELMVGLVVVAVLLLLVLPHYQGQTRSVNRRLASVWLQQAAARQEQFYAEHRRYAQRLTELGYPDDRPALTAQGKVAGQRSPDRIYLLELSTVTLPFTFRALPQRHQRHDSLCATLVLHGNGMKAVSGTGEVGRCW